MKRVRWSEVDMERGLPSNSVGRAYRQNPLPPQPPVPDRAPLVERVDRAVFVTAEPAIKWVFWAWLGLTMAVVYGWVFWG